MAGDKRVIIQLSEDDKSDIAKMYSDGKSTLEISEYIGCSRTTVYYHLRQMKLVGNFKWTESLDKTVIDHCRKSMSRKEISSILGIPVKRVVHRIGYLRKLGKI